MNEIAFRRGLFSPPFGLLDFQVPGDWGLTLLMKKAQWWLEQEMEESGNFLQ